MLTRDCRLTGSESIKVGDSDATILDFWRWAFSDLKANSMRGILAEWIVANLLDIESPVRDPWAECDLLLDNIRIEVKASAYLQAWKQKKPSNIIFSGLCARIEDFEKGYAAHPTYNADFYVLCVQIEQDPDKWDALDLDQWRFYILTRQQLAKTGCKSLGLAAVRKMSEEITSHCLRRCLDRLINQNDQSCVRPLRDS